MTLNELLMVKLYSEYNQRCECQTCQQKEYLYWGDVRKICERCGFRFVYGTNPCRCRKYVIAKTDSDNRPIRDSDGEIIIETREDGTQIEKWI